MPYASASDVANLCRNLLGSEPEFGTSSSPTLLAVESWLSSGCSIIETQLSSLGYAVPIPTGTIAGEWLRDLNTLYAAARSEMSRINITISPGERTRGQVMEEYFWKQLAQLQKMNLSNAGATQSTSGATLFVGGTSKASKDTYQSDSDRVGMRFHHGLFDMPGTVQPVEPNADSE